MDPFKNRHRLGSNFIGGVTPRKMQTSETIVGQPNKLGYLVVE